MPPPERASDRGHATAKFDVVSGKQKKSPSNAPQLYLRLR